MQDAIPAWKDSLPTPPLFFLWRFSLGLYVVAPEQSRDFWNNQVLTCPPGESSRYLDGPGSMIFQKRVSWDRLGATKHDL